MSLRDRWNSYWSGSLPCLDCDVMADTLWKALHDLGHVMEDRDRLAAELTATRAELAQVVQDRDDLLGLRHPSFDASHMFGEGE